MKRMIAALCCAGLLAAACAEDKINTYEGANYVQFSKPYADSTNIAFLYAPGQPTIDSLVTVEMSGLAYDAPRSYKLVVVEEMSTAREGVHFTLPENTSFAPGEYTATAAITFIRTEEMKTADLRLVLRLEANENFGLGQFDYQYKIFRINDKISRPAWWTTAAEAGASSVETVFLGRYSDKKFEEFIKVTGKVDLSAADYAEKRTYALQFKYYLQEKSNAGQTIYEDDGNKMVVNVVG